MATLPLPWPKFDWPLQPEPEALRDDTSLAVLTMQASIRGWEKGTIWPGLSTLVIVSAGASARWSPVPCLGLPDHQWPPHPAATTLPLSKSPHHLRDPPPHPNHRENKLAWREHFFPSGNPRYFELREGGKVRTHGGAGRGPLSLLSLLQLSPIQLERNAAALSKFGVRKNRPKNGLYDI